MSLFGRVTLIAVALAVALWSAIGFRDAKLLDQGRDRALLVTSHTSAAQVRDIDRELKRAEWLNPDVLPIMYRGGMRLISGHPRAALPFLERAVSRAPQDLTSNVLLYRALSAVDPRRAKQQARRIHDLSPIGTLPGD